MEEQEPILAPPEEEAAVLTNILGLRRQIDALKGRTRRVELDLRDTNLVDHTVLVKLAEIADEWSRDGRQFVVLGLDRHNALSAHPQATRVNRTSPATEAS